MFKQVRILKLLIKIIFAKYKSQNKFMKINFMKAARAHRSVVGCVVCNDEIRVRFPMGP